MSKSKERFLSVYNNTIHRDGFDTLLRWLEDSDFFVAPASTKFHGCHEGGLLQHMIAEAALKSSCKERREIKLLTVQDVGTI